MKQCSRCKQLLPESMFSKQKVSKDGLNYWCKECRKEYDKKYYQENKKYWKESDRKYFQEIKEYMRKWHQEHEGFMKEYLRKWGQTSNRKAVISKAHAKRDRNLSFIPLYPIGTPCLITGSNDICFHLYTDKYVIPIDRTLYASVGNCEPHKEKIKELLGPKLVREIEEKIRLREEVKK